MAILGIFSRRVFVAAACVAGLATWIHLYEPDPPEPVPLLPKFSEKLTRLSVTAGTASAQFETDREGFRLVGPKDVLERELKKEQELDKRAKEAPAFAGLVGDKVPSVWRRQRISGLAVNCLLTLRAQPMATVPAPSPADRALFGVDDPSVTVTVTAGEHEYSVKIGKKSPTALGYYFFLPQTHAYGLVPTNLVSNLRRLAAVEIPEE